MTDGPRGKLIVLEGTDFAGTTTHARLLVGSLRIRGSDAVVTAEPTQALYGQLARESIGLRKPFVTQLLFCIDRADHQDFIRTHLERGIHVVCDRYTLSTEIYGKVSGLSESERRALHCVNETFISPDFTVILTASYETLLQRKRERNGQSDEFETDTFLKQTHREYCDIPFRPRVWTNDSVECTQAAIMELIVRELDI